MYAVPATWSSAFPHQGPISTVTQTPTVIQETGRKMDTPENVTVCTDGWILAEDNTCVNPTFYTQPEPCAEGLLTAEDGTCVSPDFYATETTAPAPAPVQTTTTVQTYDTPTLAATGMDDFNPLILILGSALILAGTATLILNRFRKAV